MNLKSNFVCLLALVMPMAACFAPAVTAAEAGDPVAGSVRLNQLGYLPGAKKLAVLPGSNSDSFSIIDTRTGKMVPVSYTHLDVYKRQSPQTGLQ